MPIAPRVMPNRHPRLLHLAPYLRGDSLGAITRAWRLRRWGIDQNGNNSAQGTTWVLHWGRFRKQWRWYWTGTYRGRGWRRREVRARVPKAWPGAINDLNDSQIEVLRSARVGGRRPYKAVTHMHHAAELQRRRPSQDFTWVLEMKGGFNKPSILERLAHDANRSGVQMAVMTLTSIPGWRTRAKLAKAQGFQVAVLPRGRKPGDWQDFADLGIKVWGRWR